MKDVVPLKLGLLENSIQIGERLSGKMIFSLFPLSRCTENSNRANSLEALSVSMRIISNRACVCVCYSVLYGWTVKLSLYSSNVIVYLYALYVSSINQVCT